VDEFDHPEVDAMYRHDLFTSHKQFNSELVAAEHHSSFYFSAANAAHEGDYDEIAAKDSIFRREQAKVIEFERRLHELKLVAEQPLLEQERKLYEAIQSKLTRKKSEHSADDNT